MNRTSGLKASVCINALLNKCLLPTVLKKIMPERYLSLQIWLGHPCPFSPAPLALLRLEVDPGEELVMQSSNTGSKSFVPSNTPQWPDLPSRAFETFVFSSHCHTLLVGSAQPEWKHTES